MSDDVTPDPKASVRGSSFINADKDDIIVLDEDEGDVGGAQPAAGVMAEALIELPVPHKTHSSTGSSSRRTSRHASSFSTAVANPDPQVHDLCIDDTGNDDLVDSDEENKGQNYDPSLTKKRKLIKQSSQRNSQSKLIKTKDVISIHDEVEKEEVPLSQGDDLFFTDHTPSKAGAGVRAGNGGGSTKRLPLHDKNGNTDLSGGGSGSESESGSDNDMGEKKVSPWARRRAGGRGLDLGYMRDLVHSDSDNDDDSDRDNGVVEEKIRKNEVKGDKGKKRRKGEGEDEETEEEIDDGDDEFELACQSKKGKKRKVKQATSSSTTAAKCGVTSKTSKTNGTNSSSSSSTSGKAKESKCDEEHGLVSLGKKIIVFAHHQVSSAL